MKKILISLIAVFVAIGVFAYEYTPKTETNSPFKSTTSGAIKQIPAGMREIKNIDEYFKYLSHEVQRKWTPYKANVNYAVTVQFTIHRDGSISDVTIVNTNYPSANISVLNAVKSGAPYQPLPQSYQRDFVKTQMILEYRR